MPKRLKKNPYWKLAVTLTSVTCAAYLQAFVIKSFINPANLLSSGFTGLAILINKITELVGFGFPVSLGMLLLNLPVAFLCYKNISKKFTFFSLVQVIMASVFLQWLNFPVIFDDVLLNIVFGGFLYGMLTVIALKGNGSTGGTDFIALYVSNKMGKSIWGYVFVFNAMILIIFGLMFGWVNAGYSILFQFISTKTIDTFYHRYKRVTLQITTTKAQAVISAYTREYRHGISWINGVGGYSHQKISLLHTVVSSYEVNDIVELVRQVDPKIIINVLKTENFYGGFYQMPFD